MKKIWYWLLIVGYVHFSEPFNALANHTEARCLWVTRWDFRTVADIQQIIRNAANFNFNIIFFQVRGNGTVYYRSQLEPFALKNEIQWDPLTVALQSAHQLNIQLHAWINVFPGWSGKAPPEEARQLYNQHPDWFMQDREQVPQALHPGYVWLSPTHPEVQKHLLKLCLELIQNYDIDGLHLDYVRFPGPGFSYDAMSVQRFISHFHQPPEALPEKWNQFRRQTITCFIRHLNRNIKKIRPALVLSAAITQNPFTSKNLYFQDAATWLATQIIDIVFPMIYTADNRLFENLLKYHQREAHDRYVFPGIMPFEASQMIFQIELSRQMQLKGHSVFAYRQLFPEHRPNSLAHQLRARCYQKAAQVPKLPWKENLHDLAGPVIEKVITYPTLVSEQQAFHVYCKMKDASGVFDDSTGSDGYGIFLRWMADSTQVFEVQMSRWANNPHLFRTDTLLPPQSVNPDFKFRIFAWDNQVSEIKLAALTDFSSNFEDFQEELLPVLPPSGLPNLGYSQLQSIRIYPEKALFEPPQPFGPPLTKVKGIAVDLEGRIWVTVQATGGVRILMPDGRDSYFSPLRTGKNVQGELLEMSSPGRIAIDQNGTVYIIANSNQTQVLKFDSYSGSALAGFKLPFIPGSLAIDGHNHLYLIAARGNRWYKLASSGDFLYDGPLSNGDQFQDIAVSPDGKRVYVVATDAAVIYKWEQQLGSGEYALVSARWRELEGVGGINVDPSGRIYVCQPYEGLILVFNEAEQFLDILPRRTEPLAVPYLVTNSFDFSHLYSIGLSAESPVQILQWAVKK